ncbi:MAG: MFS transporter [Chloroflexota bacterium]|nr:MFS transporter [Chloroflexota bacterium]
MVFKHRIGAYGVHLTGAALMSLASALIWTTMMVYQIQVVGLTPLQLVLLGTTMEVTIFLFEIPTGIVADVFSRRLSCIIGFFGMALAYLIQLIPTFEVLVLANVVWGIGYTFTSGAYDAWVVDELGQERAGLAFLRAGQVGRVTGIGGVIGAATLGSIDLRLPILLGGLIIFANALFLFLFMPEDGFAPTPRADRTTFGKLIDTFRDGARVVRARPMLLRILGVGFFFGLFSEAWDRLWQAHLLLTFDLANNGRLSPIAVIALLDIVMMGVLTVAAEIMRRHVNLNDGRQVIRALIALTAGMVVGIIGYGLAPSLAAALVAFMVFNIGRGLIDPLLRTWSNANIDSDVRATVLSMQSQTDAIGQAVGGAPLGALGNLSLRLAFVVSGASLSPALWLMRRAGRAERARVSEVEAV